MTILEAIKEGMGFKRKDWSYYFIITDNLQIINLTTGETFDDEGFFCIADILAEDWVIRLSVDSPFNTLNKAKELAITLTPESQSGHVTSEHHE